MTKAFQCGGITLEWDGNIGKGERTGKVYVEQNAKYFRPTEVDFLCGDASKAKELLGWEPEINLEDLIKQMIN